MSLGSYFRGRSQQELQLAASGSEPTLDRRPALTGGSGTAGVARGRPSDSFPPSPSRTVEPRVGPQPGPAAASFPFPRGVRLAAPRATSRGLLPPSARPERLGKFPQPGPLPPARPSSPGTETGRARAGLVSAPAPQQWPGPPTWPLPPPLTDFTPARASGDPRPTSTPPPRRESRARHGTARTRATRAPPTRKRLTVPARRPPRLPLPPLPPPTKWRRGRARKRGPRAGQSEHAVGARLGQWRPAAACCWGRGGGRGGGLARV